MRKALFLDRDGVVNVDHDFVHRIADFEFREGIFDLARLATSCGLLVIVVTNQSGIGRGFYTEEDFASLTSWMLAEFEREGAPIDRVYHCPTHPDFPSQRDHEFENWRKPAPGMLFQAALDFDIDLQASFMIGDRLSDFEAAKAAGVGAFLLVRSSRSGAAVLEDVDVCDTLSEAEHWLRGKHVLDRSLSER